MTIATHQSNGKSNTNHKRDASPLSGWAPAKPCPVCGKTNKSGWCSQSLDGRVVCCRSQEDGCFASREDVNGVPYYLHHSDGEPVAGDWSHYQRGAARRANPNHLDFVYGVLLGCLDLDDQHRRDLRRRGLTKDDIDERRYRSLPAGGHRLLAA